MRYSEFMNKRESLIKKAEECLNNNNVDESNKIINEIKKLDAENSEMINLYNKKINNLINEDEEREEHIRKANENALEGNKKPFNIYENGLENVEGHVIETTGNYIGGENKVKNVFLNKNDKLEDRIIISDPKEREILNSDGALGNVIKGMVTGKWSSPELKNVISTTSSGTLIPEVLSSKIIDKAREISLFTTANVPILPMDSNNVTISRVKTDPTFKFKEEGKEGSDASFELDSIKLESKTVYGYAYVSLEAINSSLNLDSILYSVFSESIANAIDKAFIYGQETKTGTKDAYAPGGIFNDTNICSITATANGGYDDFIKAIGKVKKENGNPTAYGINSYTDELLSLLKTTDGKYLDQPKSMETLQRIVSNQLSHNTTSGDDAIVFDPNALIIGIQNNIQIKIIEDTECLKKGLVGFQIYSMLDCKTTIPKHICKITGIK